MRKIFFHLVKLSIRIPIITALILFLTLGVNIFGLKKSIDIALPIYIETKQEQAKKTELDPKKLETILSISKLNTSKKIQYSEVLKELNSLSTSLESLSANPELYVGKNEILPSSQAFYVSASWWSDKTESHLHKVLSLLSRPFDFEANSPEWILLRSIFSDFLIINGLWFALILLFYFFWIRHFFSPINVIINQLQELLQNPENQKIIYNKKDEFYPLIRALNKLRESLNSQEKVRSHFLADLSHEIRTPITSIKCYLESIESGVMKLDDTSIPLFQKEIARLIEITEQIMSYESLVNEQMSDTNKTHIPLKKTMDEFIVQYIPQFEKNKQTITHSFDESMQIFADENQYRQILHNIFSNFIKYAGVNTKLRCSCQVRWKRWYLVFSDNWVGIPDESIDFVRKKFFKWNMDRHQNSKNPVSMGIGLSIIDRIMLLHNGTLQIHNNHPHWLVITLYFPSYEKTH